MASVSIKRQPKNDRDDKLCYRVAYRDLYKKQHAKRCFFEDEDAAELFRASFKAFISRRERGQSICEQLQSWLDHVDDSFFAALVDCGLATSTSNKLRGMTCRELADWFTAFTDSRTDLKQTTKDKKALSLDYFATIFGDRRVDELTMIDGQWFLQELERGQGRPRTDKERKTPRRRNQRRRKSGVTRSSSTRRKNLQHVCEAFDLAVCEELIRRNPFAKVPKPSEVKGSTVFIGWDDTQKLIELAEENDHKVILWLARAAGPRIVSEIAQLRWSDVIDHDTRTGGETSITFASPKTEHHAGKEGRACPLLFGSAKALRELRPSDAGDTDFIISDPKLRTKGANDRWLVPLIAKAGFVQWPGLWKSFRVSAEDDLRAIPGVNQEQVSLWIGHELSVYRKNYRRYRSDESEVKRLENEAAA